MLPPAFLIDDNGNNWSAKSFCVWKFVKYGEFFFTRSSTMEVPVGPVLFVCLHARPMPFTSWCQAVPLLSRWGYHGQKYSNVTRKSLKRKHLWCFWAANMDLNPHHTTPQNIYILHFMRKTPQCILVTYTKYTIVYKNLKTVPLKNETWNPYPVYNQLYIFHL